MKYKKQFFTLTAVFAIAYFVFKVPFIKGEYVFYPNCGFVEGSCAGGYKKITVKDWILNKINK